MPELNRDRERLYRPGSLSKVFLVTSGLLLVSLAWMVFADYSRPWKGIQKGFYAKRSEVLQARQSKARAQLQRDEALRALGEELRKARLAFEADPEVARLRADALAARRLETQADTELKSVNGTWAEKKYEVEKTALEHAEGHASAEDLAEVREEYAALGKRRDALAVDKAKHGAEAGEKERRLAELERHKKELEKRFAARTKAIADDEAAIADARAKGESLWRNALGIDFLVPTIVPRKVVNPHVHDNFNFATSPKVDMCMSCHMGANDPVMALETPGVEVPDVYRAHPHLDLLLGPNSPHKMDAIGCTVCHAGRGWSLDFARAAHTPRDAAQAARWKEEHDWGPARWVDFPMLPHDYVQGQCFKCHVEGLYYGPEVAHAELSPDGAPPRAIAEPERLFRFEQYVAKRDAQGKPTLLAKVLDQAGDAPIPLKGTSVVPGVRRDTDGDGDVDADDSPELFLPVVAKAPSPVEDPARLPDARWRPGRLEEGQGIVTEYGCYGCHLIRDFPKLPGFPRETADRPLGDLSTPVRGTLINGLPKVGWDLTYAADKLNPHFVRAWLKNPTSYRSDTRMPAFFWHTPHDAKWNPVRRPDGTPDERHVHPDPDGTVARESEVEIEAIATFLAWASKRRAEPYPEPPPGDPKRGSDTFFTVGCFGCHLGPDRWKDESWAKDDGARFGDDPAQGPRLTAMGSKTTAKWLYDWLAEPRHYWSTTRMPNMRWRDETAADGKTVVRSADQQRADVVAYLMRGRDADFEAVRLPTRDEKAPWWDARKPWTEEHGKHLDAMWKEFFGKGVAPTALDRRVGKIGDYWTGSPGYVPEPATAAERETRLEQMGKLAAVGEKLVTLRGCFGCHNVAGTEDAKQIGKELTNEGTQDIHKFDFGLGHIVGHTRWEWVEKKLEDPRVFDTGRIKLWTERLKMPKFNVRADERTSVTAFVLGLVGDEPVKADARFRPDEAEREILAGRAVVARYGCDSCHTIEGKVGLLTREQSGQESWMLPPNLYGEGNRRRSDHLFHFLKAPKDLRPGVIQRMPMFRLSDEEATALVDYFTRLAGRSGRASYDALDAPLDATPYAEPKAIEYVREGKKLTATVRSDVEQAKTLFDVFNCASCHLPKGTPGADPSQGGSAPPFTVVGPMLRRDWVVAFLRDPQTQSQGTKMPQFYPLKSKRARKPGATLALDQPGFRFDCGADCTSDEVAEAQMKALARYLIYHYEPSVPTPAEPAPGAGK